MNTPQILRQDADRYRKLLALGIPDEQAKAALHDLIDQCETNAAALESQAKAPSEAPPEG